MRQFFALLMIVMSLSVLAGCDPAEQTSTPDPATGNAQSSLESPLPIGATALSEPVDQRIVTPVPTLLAAIPTVDITPISLQNGRSFNLIMMPQDRWLDGPFAPCDLDASPDGKWAAISIGSGEGWQSVTLVDTANGHGFSVNMITQFDLRTAPVEKSTWFRGWFPDSKRVLLMSDWLEILDIQAGERRAATPDVGQPDHVTVTDAAISPDGQTIVYTTIDGNALYLISTEGKQRITIQSPAPQPGDRPENLTWSPDGEWIAYTWDQGIAFGAGPLWLVDASGENARQLSPSGTHEVMIAWAPDSSRVLIARRENTNDVAADFDPTKWISDLWLASPNGEVWSQLTHLEGKSAWSPMWTPDGSAVVFMSNLSGQPEVWLINADGSGLRQITFGSQMMPCAFGILS